MEIQSTPMGAVVDVTDEAVATVLEMLADALRREPIRTERLLYGLRDAVETRGRFLAANVPVSQEAMAEVSADVDAVRDALAALLEGRVIVKPTAYGCLQYGAELIAAGEKARHRFRTPGQPVQLPGQRDRRVA